MTKHDNFEKIWQSWIRNHIVDCPECKKLLKEGQICSVAWDTFETLFKTHVIRK